MALALKKKKKKKRKWELLQKLVLERVAIFEETQKELNQMEEESSESQQFI